ncbi:hypothetical protein ABZ669_07090 [Streptomyces hirsutus]|uniref:hypothetical protein n=1 Tax=Streptomyces hirsutus TaxID=35620 RepID=UPI0033F18A5A
MDDTIWGKEDLSPFGECDWPTWAEGDTWMARRGTDFHCEPEVFVNYLVEMAEYEGRTREVISRIIGDDVVCFRLLDPAEGPEELSAFLGRRQSARAHTDARLITGA